MTKEMENAEDFEAKETSRVLPIGWTILYVGLILWGVYYLYTYTPSLGGWSQAGAYEQSLSK